MNIHRFIDSVRAHFYRADYLRLKYTLPVEAYSLHRRLQYEICGAWNRVQQSSPEYPLTQREGMLLAEAWLMSAPDQTKPMYVNLAWRAKCAGCDKEFSSHRSHPDNNAAGDPPDRFLCSEGSVYTPVQYKLPMSGRHPSELDP